MRDTGRYAAHVTEGEFLESDEWAGRLGTYRVDFYLTGPLDENTTDGLRYGYQIGMGSTVTTRDGFASACAAEEHARLVMREHDSGASWMSAPF